MCPKERVIMAKRGQHSLKGQYNENKKVLKAAFVFKWPHDKIWYLYTH